MRALVTGGGGFVGFEVVRQLRSRGDDVCTLARGEYPKLAALGATQIRGDLADPQVVRDAVAGMDVVFHVAAKAGVWGDAADYERSNITGTQNVIDACIHNSVGRLVFTSSPSVTFDGGDAAGADESLPYPSSHLYHYGRTKAEAERRVLGANGSRLSDGRGVLLTCALRPHLVFGAGDPHIFPRMVKRARAGRLMWIGAATNLVDVTYVENAALAHVLAADGLAAETPRPAGKAYFISQGTPVEPAAFVNRVLRAVGIPEVRRRIPLGAAYVIGALCEAAWSTLPLRGEPLMTRFLAAQLGTSHHYNLAAARRDLGYEPTVDLDVAVQRTAQWLAEEIAAGRL